MKKSASSPDSVGELAGLEFRIQSALRFEFLERIDEKTKRLMPGAVLVFVLKHWSREFRGFHEDQPVRFGMFEATAHVGVTNELQALFWTGDCSGWCKLTHEFFKAAVGQFVSDRVPALKIEVDRTRRALDRLGNFAHGQAIKALAWGRFLGRSVRDANG